MGWTGNFVGRREARLSRLDLETKHLDPNSRVKNLEWQRENELRLEIREAYL